jgi:hypothetical protein
MTVSETSWSDYSGADGGSYDTSSDAAAAAADLSAGTDAASWADWNDATGQEWNFEANGYLGSAEQDLAGGWEDSAASDLSAADTDAGLAGDSYQSATDYSAQASADFSAASSDVSDD